MDNKSNIFIIGSFITLIVSLILLLLSTFQMGINQNDKESTSYKITQYGVNFLSIIFIIALSTLLYNAYTYRECDNLI
jgi:hypothetical protein